MRTSDLGDASHLIKTACTMQLQVKPWKSESDWFGEAWLVLAGFREAL